MVIPLWFICALVAAVSWGLYYALFDRLLKSGFSLSFLMAITSVVLAIFYIFVALTNGHWKEDVVRMLASLDALKKLGIAILVIIIGNYAICYSISVKNATLANLVEISYPIFTFLFAWALFKDVQLTAWAAVGACFVFVGIGIIFMKG